MMSTTNAGDVMSQEQTNTNLQEQLDIAHTLLETEDTDVFLNALHLAELVDAMHKSIAAGGPMPDAWKGSKTP